MRKPCVTILALAAGGVAAAGTLTVKFGSAMEVEIDGTVQSFAANATFMPTAIPCIYKMRPVLGDGERTFAIESTEKIRGNDVYRRFPQYGDDNWVRVALDPYPSSDTTVTLTGYKTSNFYYVDAEKGNDDWDGKADYANRDESNNKGPKKSLQAAHDVATGNYPIVFAAPGVYNTGVATNYSSGTSNPCIRRLIATKKNIGFIAAEGAGKTFIVGAPDTSGTDGKFGAESVSGVYMQSNYAQFIQGFTITGCYSPATQSGAHQYGMAFCSGAHRAYCLDCVISNNYAVTSGSATYYGVMERARIMENKSSQYTTRNGVFVSCVFAGNTLTMSDTTDANRALQQSAQSYFCTYDLRTGNPPSGGRKRLEDNDSSLHAALVCGLTEKSTTTTNATRWCDSKAIDDPLFADAAARDYRLGIKSPARNSSSYVDDLNGVGRMVMTSDIDGRMPSPHDGQLHLGAVWNEPQFWYVAQNGGNDANDGTSPASAKATINAAVVLSFSGDTIRVAPGTYGESEGVWPATSKIGARIVLPEDVTIESTGGATNTFIVGAAATGSDIDNEAYGTGTNAVRCVYAKNGATVRGFTLTGGRTAGKGDNADGWGSAFYSTVDGGAAIEDCIVSNNAAYRGTLYQAVVRRCRIFDNIGVNNSQSGAAGYKCRMYGSIIDRNGGGGTVSYSYDIVNCTFGAANYALNGAANFRVIYTSGTKSLVNCAILGGGVQGGTTTLFLTNCLVVSNWMWGDSYVYQENRYQTIYTNSATVASDTYSPVFGLFAGIDKGSNAFAPASMDGKDIFGRPRIMNGAIDIGAVEYDWRPTFAHAVGKKLTLTDISPSVTTNAAGWLLIPSGAVAGTVTERGKFYFTFTLSGGSLEAFVGGTSVGVYSAEGEQTIRIDVPDAATEFRLVFTPDAENPSPMVLKKIVSGGGFIISFG